MSKRKKAGEGALLAKKKKKSFPPKAALQGELCHLVGCSPFTGQRPESGAGEHEVVGVWRRGSVKKPK